LLRANRNRSIVVGYAARAGHRRGSYPRARWFDSIGCDLIVHMPPLQGWDTTLRRSLVEVRILSVAPGEPDALRYLRNVHRSVTTSSAIGVCVAFWEVSGFQPRACSVRFTGDVRFWV